MHNQQAKRLLKCVALVTIGVLVVHIYYTKAFMKPQKQTTTQENKTSSLPEQAPKKQFTKPEELTLPGETVKVVLFYTTWFGQEVWPAKEIDKDTHMFIYREKQQCEHKCRLTYDKNELHTSDAVIFHGNDMPANIHEMSRNRKNYKQRWIYNTQENAYYAGRDASTMNGIFNWTLTHRLDADIPFPYGIARKLRSDEIAKVKVEQNPAKSKTNLITWSIGHCRTESLRDNIVEKLTEFLPVVINGKCAELFPKRENVPSCGKRNDPMCDELYRSTKFYLAFENALCEYYVTEKYWTNALDFGMVPIVFGPQKYYQNLAIPGSYINLFDFPSIEALANYIKYLDKNDTAYNEYFKWKTKYISSEVEFACDFCKMLHDDKLPSKTYNNLGDLYGRAACDKNLDKVKEYLTRRGTL